MKLKNDFEEYLLKTNIVDFDNDNVAKLASSLYDKDYVKCINNCFCYVRDNISHIADIKGHDVVCNASDVLRIGYGDCCAKSHLLVALLRYNKIPSGFCYQRLILDDEQAPFLVIHGLVGVFVDGKWQRIDSRGNKPGVDAQFIVGTEKIAFHTRKEYKEEDIMCVYAYPDNYVVDSLVDNKTFEELWSNLPKDLYER